MGLAPQQATRKQTLYPKQRKKKSKQTSSEKKIIPLPLGFFSSLFGSQLPTFKA